MRLTFSPLRLPWCWRAVFPSMRLEFLRPFLFPPWAEPLFPGTQKSHIPFSIFVFFLPSLQCFMVVPGIAFSPPFLKKSPEEASVFHPFTPIAPEILPSVSRRWGGAVLSPFSHPPTNKNKLLFSLLYRNTRGACPPFSLLSVIRLNNPFPSTTRARIKIVSPPAFFLEKFLFFPGEIGPRAPPFFFFSCATQPRPCFPLAHRNQRPLPKRRILPLVPPPPFGFLSSTGPPLFFFPM